MTAPGQRHITYQEPPAVPPPFARIVCGVNGTRTSKVAVAQALELAGPGGSVDFVSFTDARGRGAMLMAGTGIVRSQAALEEARRAAADRGVRARTELRHHAEPRRALVERAGDGDLLVVGARPGSRAGGIMLGSTATFALHECAVPVLIARPVPGDRPLADRVLVATTGSGAERRASRRAAEVAAAASGRLTLLHVEGHTGREVRHELAEEAADAREITGVEPVVVTVRGHGPDPIVGIAREVEATLVVLGSRGLTGVRALASVSERVGAAAACPVLVVRNPA